MNINPYQSPSTKPDEPNTKSSVSKSYSGCAAAFFLILGAGGGLLGTAWIRTFGFTDYRSHLAHIGLPLGIATAAFSVLFIWFGVAIIRKRLNHS